MRNSTSGSGRKKSFAPSPILIVLLLSAALNVYAIWWGLPSLRGWGTDEIVPATVVKALGLHFSNGWTDIYPPFHYMLLGAAYLPFLGLQKIGLFRQGEDEPAATGRFVHVWVDRATQRPAGVPPRIRDALVPLLA